jgi:hypothetical protein
VTVTPSVYRDKALSPGEAEAWRNQVLAGTALSRGLKDGKRSLKNTGSPSFPETHQRNQDGQGRLSMVRCGHGNGSHR